jgi:hypothetical protein
MSGDSRVCSPTSRLRPRATNFGPKSSTVREIRSTEILRLSRIWNLDNQKLLNSFLVHQRTRNVDSFQLTSTDRRKLQFSQSILHQDFERLRTVQCFVNEVRTRGFIH